MLIEICPDVDFSSLSEEEIHVLDLIAESHQSGNHLIGGDVASLEFLSAWEKLTPRSRSIYKKLKLRWVQLGSLYNLARISVVIGHYDSIEFSSKGERRIIKFPFSLVNMNFLIPTTLMLEDTNDEDMYKLILNWYLVVGNSIGDISGIYNYRLQSGNGIRTAANFKHFIENNLNLILCVLDTDRKYPGDILGATAEKASALEPSPLGKLLVLDVHERENLIPYSIYEKIHEEHGAADGQLRQSFVFLAHIHENFEAFRYLDIKSGFVCRNFNSVEKENMKNYWLPLLEGLLNNGHACKGASCDNVLFRNFPKQYLPPVIASVKNNPQEVSMCDSLAQQWAAIAEEIFGWCISNKKSIT